MWGGRMETRLLLPGMAPLLSGHRTVLFSAGPEHARNLWILHKFCGHFCTFLSCLSKESTHHPFTITLFHLDTGGQHSFSAPASTTCSHFPPCCVTIYCSVIFVGPKPDLWGSHRSPQAQAYSPGALSKIAGYSLCSIPFCETGYDGLLIEPGLYRRIIIHWKAAATQDRRQQTAKKPFTCEERRQN